MSAIFEVYDLCKNPSFAKKIVWSLFIFLIFFDVFLLVVFLQGKGNATITIYPEIHDLEGKQLSFKDLSNYFSNLAEKKGAKYAYEVLKIAPTPPNIDLHLLAHVVGDILYRQEKADGIEVCTHDFRNACSHSIVIGLLIEEGEEGLLKINESCQKAPGGSGAYTMCFHGLGHGVLAYTGYDLPKAIELCKKTGTHEYNYNESAQCIGGTIMEIIGGGFHDQELWEKQSKKYLRESDPLYPCTSDFMPEEGKWFCYVYLTPNLLKAAGANLANPGPADFEKAFKFCDEIPEIDTMYRDVCYGGFGKEFVVLAKNRDVRNIENITNEELTTIYEWCLLARDEEGIKACINHALQSLYWGGENNRGVAVNFCSLVQNQFHQLSCFRTLIGAVSFYINDADYKREFCEELPPIYHEKCRNKFGI